MDAMNRKKSRKLFLPIFITLILSALTIYNGLGIYNILRSKKLLGTYSILGFIVILSVLASMVYVLIQRIREINADKEDYLDR